LPEGQVSDISLGRQKDDAQGVYADELNEFRRKVSKPLKSLGSISDRSQYFTKNEKKLAKEQMKLHDEQISQTA